MPESGLILPADSTGKAMRTATTTTTFTSGTGGLVHQQVITPADVNGQVQSVTPFGAAHVENPNHLLLADQFNGTVLDTVQWTASGTVAPVVLNGTVTFPVSTTASASSAISSVALPKQFMSQFAIRADFGNGQPSNVHRFVGLGTVPGTWTAAAPLQDAMGFEMTTAGVFRAVIYAGGAVVQSFTLPTPTTAAVYIVALKPGWHGFYINSLENLVVELQGQSPQTELLPVRAHSINGTTAPASAPTLAIGGVAISDGGQNTVSLNDGTYPWRKITVDSIGRLNSAVSGLPINGPAATTISGASSVYTMDVSAAGNATLWFVASAALSGGTWVFEQSNNGSAWAPLGVVRSDTNAVGTTFSGVTIAAGSSLAFDAACEGVSQIRVRCTVAATGTATVVGLGGGMPFSPAVAVGNTVTTSIAAYPALAKGTQYTTGVATQDLKDSGRALVTGWVTAVTTSATAGTETLFATQWQRAGTAQTTVAPATSPSGVTVATGKTFRIQNITVSMRNASAAIAYVRFTLRYVTSGQVAVGSNALWEIEIGPTGAVQGLDRTSAEFPDGLELPAGSVWNMTYNSNATTNIATFSLTGYEY